MFAVLRRRNFALLWFGQLISLLGDWVLLLTLPFYVYQRTGSVLATGTMFFVETIPTLLFGTLVGVFVDRWDRKWIMIIADLLMALLLLPLLFLPSRSFLWIVYVVAFFETFLSLFFNPAQGALTPHLVEEQELTAANSLNSLSTSVMRLIGPVLGGAMLGLLGISSIIIVDSASFIFSAIMVVLIALPATETRVHATTGPHESHSSVWSEWLEGLRLVRSQQLLSALFIITAITMIGEGFARVAVVPFLSKVAGGNALLFGIIVTSQGVGATIGSLMLDRASKAFSSFRLVILGAMASAIFFSTGVTFPLFPVVLPFTALGGITIVFLFVSIYVLIQRNVADHYRGRVFGAYNTLNTLLLLVGMLLSSLLADRLGVRAMMFLAGGFYFLGGIAAFLLLRRYVSQKNMVEQAVEPHVSN